ncbi:MAG: pyroglutamyl-peptidase I [Thermoplasmatota archaeon]
MKATVLALALLIALPAFAVPQTVEPDVVLVTGFEPFGQWDSNPSGEIALALNDSMVGDVRIIGLVLPVIFDTSYARMREAMDRYDPAAVIALGLDGGARAMEVERLAVNLQHPSWLRFSRINTSGSLFRRSMLPADDIVAALRDDGIAARRSWCAGLYVCNYVFYRLLGDAGRWGIPAGFIHVPPLPAQQPYGMEPETMLRGVRAAVNVTVAA